MIFAVLGALLSGGCRNYAGSGMEESCRIKRFFCWGRMKSEADAAKYAAAGVTDIKVHNQKSFQWAQKYGITAYCGSLTPAGPHPQVMSPEETAFHRYINGMDLPAKMPVRERKRIIDARRREKDHRYGGNRVNPLDTINVKSLPCFSCDRDLRLTRQKIDNILKRAVPGVKGIYLDYFGYANHRGCYCSGCLERLRSYLEREKLADTPANRDEFYRQELLDYYDKVIAYIKSKRPDFKIVAHFYPDFEPDPWYGTRTRVDFGGHTVSWYFKWNAADTSGAVRNILLDARKYHSGVEAIPFIGINVKPTTSLAYKSPGELEADLKAVISGGGRSVMICSGSAVLVPGYFEVFRKYCGRQPDAGK